MNVNFFSLLLLLLTISCNNESKKNNFESQMDLLKLNIPTITENQNFSFSEFSKDIWNWHKSHKFIEIDSIIWIDYCNNPTPLGDYRYDYQTNYYYETIDLQDDFTNLIILQYIHNNNESYMYLLQFDKKGNRRKVFVLASIFKSPDEYEEIHSSIQGNKIITYKYYDDDGTVKRDTTITLW
jgi:hypothetical protein